MWELKIGSQVTDRCLKEVRYMAGIWTVNIQKFLTAVQRAREGLVTSIRIN